MDVEVSCRGGYEGVHLRVDGCGGVLPVDGEGLPLLEYLAEPFRQALCRFSDHLPAEDVAHRVLDDLRLLVPVVAGKLREVLEAETDGHLVASGGGDEIVDTTEIDGRQLVDDDGALELPFLVHKLHDTGIVQSQCRRIDILPVRIVAYAKNLRVFGIVQIQREIITRHHPVKLWRDHARKRDFRARYLALELVLCASLPSVHERGKVVFEGRI